METNEAPSSPNTASSRRLELLLDVPLELSVELGRTRMSIQELLSLGPGSVIELDKVAGEPLDILVNDRLVARGEAVVVNDKFGIRITDIVSPAERIARLR
jgi:flagellar motor switch protein FliN